MIADHFKYVDVNGVRTRYFEKGSGRPLVLIHGGAIGTGSSLDVFAENLEVLAESFRVIAPDKLAHGETDNPATDADYTIAAMTDHLLRFIQTLELDDINLIGQSRGAFNSTTLCLDHPNLIRGFVLCNSRGRWERSAPPEAVRCCVSKPNIGSIPMAVSPPPAPSSIDLSGLPPRVVEAAARVLALCREELRAPMIIVASSLVQAVLAPAVERSIAA